ncbi:hypothetical protein [Modestobacter marinus]|uniref:hypothetical protein n=1 Tax=Modestobacter marinus TaxID=477641 RepID=UPI001C954CFF|nr:hypothetical protein [Modestobacter marinus]
MRSPSRLRRVCRSSFTVGTWVRLRACRCARTLPSTVEKVLRNPALRRVTDEPIDEFPVVRRSQPAGPLAH